MQQFSQHLDQNRDQAQFADLGIRLLCLPALGASCVGEATAAEVFGTSPLSVNFTRGL